MYFIYFPRIENLKQCDTHYTVRERSHMTSAAEGGGGFKMLTVADKGGGDLSLADVSKNTFGKNCFKSSVPITMLGTTALIYSPKLMTTFSFKLDKINI